MSNIKFSNRIEPLSGSAIREIFKFLADPSIISLAGGNPSPQSFPVEEISKITTELLQSDSMRILQYGATEGWLPLVDEVLKICQNKNLTIAKENLLILTGSSQGIELTTKVLLNEGDVVLVENPTFLGALQTFRSYSACPIGVDMDDEGVKLDDLEQKIIAHKPKLLYLIPNFQNPTGKTMSLQRRKDVLAMASKYNVLILEDDPYGELRYSGENIANIKELDKDNQVILLNSFSKTVSPGLRVGFAVADSTIIRKMVIAKQGMDTHTAILSQAIIAEFLRRGYYQTHLQKTIAFYKKQLETIQKAIKIYFPPQVQVTNPEGGLFLWVTLPKEIDANTIFEEAIKNKVAFIIGKHFYANEGGDNEIRLNFSMPSIIQIEEGIERLGQIMTKLMK